MVIVDMSGLHKVKIIFPLVALISPLAGSSSLRADEPVRHSIREYKRCEAAGHIFILKRDTRDGILREEYSIDGKPIDYEQYQDKLIKARAEELRVSLNREREHAEREAERMLSIKRSATKRLLEVSFSQLQSEIKRIRDYELEPHLQWNTSTIPSASDYNYLVSHFMPSVDYMLKNISETESIPENLSDYALKCEEYASKLRELFHASADYFIAHCSDTGKLKKILEL
jgi:hypothetical protein